MPRIWIANEWLDPSEECGGMPHDYCEDCFEEALCDWLEKLEHAIDKGEFTLKEGDDLYDIVVDYDEHPDYDDCGYHCDECDNALDEGIDG